MARWLFVLLAFAAAAPAGAAPIVVRDDVGRMVTLPRPATRIATLAPFLTELVYSAGAGDRVVAVSEHSDFPPGARAKPTVLSAVGLSMEPLAATRPDLVLAWQDAIRPADLERLAALGIPVFVAQARALEDVPRMLRAIATLVGGDASAAAQAYVEQLAALRAAHEHMAPMPVLLEIWHQPLTTLAGRHWINEALAICGARNAFGDLPGIAPEVSWELVIARAPRAIVGAGSAANHAAFLQQWQDRSMLEAVRRGRLVFVDGDLLQRPTLRLAEGVAALCEGLDRVR